MMMNEIIKKTKINENKITWTHTNKLFEKIKERFFYTDRHTTQDEKKQLLSIFLCFAKCH